MLTEKEAQDIFTKYIELKNLAGKDRKHKIELQKQEEHMMKEFKYLISSKTSKYKTHNNYDDLNQDGYEALLMGLKTYSPEKGSIFWWLHKYIGTKVSRAANMHSVIRSSIKRSAKGDIPKREELPINLLDKTTPYDILNQKEINLFVNDRLSKLSKEDFDIITTVYKMNEKETGIDVKANKISNRVAKIIRKLRKI